MLADPTSHFALQEHLENALFQNGPPVFPTRDSSTDANLGPLPKGTALIVETSGSTSRPKRVWHTVASLRSAAEQVNHALGAPGVWWQVLPAHYIAGVMVLVRALYSGSPVFVANPSRSTAKELVRFDQEASRESPNPPRYTSVVPKQLADLLDAAESDAQAQIALQRFSRILVGGQAVPKSLLERAKKIGVKVTRTYGSAETAGGCVWSGAPLRDTVVDIYDERVALAGPMLAGGYLGDPDRTSESFHNRQGKRWFVSDDCGEWVDGILKVTGRVDRTIISGGEKVNLDEVENVLLRQYPDREWAVIAVADQKWGQALAVVMTEALDKDTLHQTVRDSFGSAARITTTHVVANIPRLSSGKVDRLAVGNLVGIRSANVGEE